MSEAYLKNLIVKIESGELDDDLKYLEILLKRSLDQGAVELFNVVTDALERIARDKKPVKYVESGFMNVADQVVFKYNHEICACFGKIYKSWLQVGGIPHPCEEGTLLWWPSEEETEGWVNVLSADESIITEKVRDPKLALGKAESWRNGASRAIIFIKEKSIATGEVQYRFIGLFAQEAIDGVVGSQTWRRVSTRVKTYKPKND